MLSRCPQWQQNDVPINSECVLCCTGELGYILDGNVSCGSDVTQLNQSGRSDFRHFPALSDKMHVVLFAVPCEEGTNSEYMAKLRTMKAFCTSRGKRSTSRYVVKSCKQQPICSNLE